MLVGAEAAPVLSEATAWEEAQALLAAAGFADGLPLVPPTAARLARMLAGVAEPRAERGLVPPLFGALTAESAAYCCVLAGCFPAELPVVLAAMEAALEPRFNLLGLQTTTGTPAVAVMVHGPAARRLGMNAGTNCLGPGNRANACIGRAVRLALMFIGGARPEIADMATMGQPGKYVFCLAERDDDPTFPPLPARRGVAPGAVTVLGVSGTLEVLPLAGEARPEAVLAPALAAIAGARSASHAGRQRPGGEHVLLVPPEIAAYFAKARWTLADLQAAARAQGADLHPVVTGGAGIKMTYLQPWGGGSESVTRAIDVPTDRGQAPGPRQAL